MSKYIPSANDLTKISQSELDAIIEEHKSFLEGRRGGGRANLKFLDLSELDFHGADLSQADFTGSCLIDANLSEGVFNTSCFFACDLHNANLEKANFTRADLRGVHLAGANLSGADLASADLREGKIMERDEDGTLIDRERFDIEDENFRWSTILSGAKLNETNLSGVKAVAADFSDADLTGARIQEADMHDVSFKGANMSDSDLTGSDFTGANLKSSIMSGANLEGVELQNAITDDALDEQDMGTTLEEKGEDLHDLLEQHKEWISSVGESGNRMDLSNIDMREVLNLREYPLTAIQAIGGNFLSQDLRDVEMQSALLDGSDFRDCRMMDADLRGSSFKEAKLSRSTMRGAKLCPLQFENGDGTKRLQRVNMSGAQMRYVDLKGADLRDAILMGADLSNAVLAECDLSRADLTGANLHNADLTDANLDGAIMD